MFETNWGLVIAEVAFFAFLSFHSYLSYKLKSRQNQNEKENGK